LANQPDPGTPIESIPSRNDGVSAIASAHAPFLYFDGAPTFGHSAGVIHVTLEAIRFHAGDGVVNRDRVTVAHLRMNALAAESLIRALQGALLLARPSESNAKN